MIFVWPLYMLRAINAFAFNLDLHLEIHMHVNFKLIRGGFKGTHFHGQTH